MSDYLGESDSLARLIGAVGRRAAPPAEDYQRVLRASREAWERAVRQRRRRQWVYALAASLAIVAIGIGLLHRLDGGAGVVIGRVALTDGGVFVGDARGDWHGVLSPGTTLLSGTRLRTDADGRVAVSLTNETSLRLGPSTDLLLAPRRRVELIAGRVYVDTRAAGGNIEIETRFGTLRDLGTQFEVLASPAGLRIRTREGAVQLLRPGTDSALVCKFDEELRIDDEGHIERGYIAPHDAEWEWAESLAEPPRGSHLPLRQFLDWVARESGRRVRYDSPDTEARVSRVVLHGTTPNLAPVQALEVTLATTDIEFVLLADGTILLRPRQAH
jgi:ferric-dicitrate binding protein FerR (iron transport regulator)